ncbi:serine/threonine-protein kinase [Pendulispora albinea]|uniref:Serine/threonine protein kinase n=1 Tax=Pendulispora albinea TaxID=2741071 RepID=A0ABZ2LTX9_9BACT
MSERGQDFPLFGSYRVLEELGVGAVSTVYKAAQPSLERTVAIKALKPTISPASPFAAHLEREARLLGELGHPNIVLCHDFVKTSEKMYLVLEYIEGFSLAELISRAGKGRVALETVAHVGAEIARGLAHAHERGIVHRDIKPSNVLLSKRGEVKIVDFGIAQREHLPTADEPLARTALPPSRSEENEAFGTPAYMSPEQVLGEFVDARSDVFSLGVVLYEMLTGTRPFERGDEGRRGAAQRLRRDPAVPLRVRAPDVPRALETVVMRSLEKLPADRYATAHAVVDLLDDFVRDRVRGPRSKLLTSALVKVRLLKESEADDVTLAHVLEERRPPLRRALIGFGVIGFLIVAAGGALQLSRLGTHDNGSGDRALELLPENMGQLRVVVTPWAEVFVDGQRIDTTPFARPIPLSPGTHYVTLVHPNAPMQKRPVTIAPGETALLDVTMDLSALADSPSAKPGLPGAAGAALGAAAGGAAGAASKDASP